MGGELPALLGRTRDDDWAIPIWPVQAFRLLDLEREQSCLSNPKPRLVAEGHASENLRPKGPENAFLLTPSDFHAEKSGEPLPPSQSRRIVHLSRGTSSGGFNGSDPWRVRDATGPGRLGLRKREPPEPVVSVCRFHQAVRVHKPRNPWRASGKGNSQAWDSPQGVSVRRPNRWSRGN